MSGTDYMRWGPNQPENARPIHGWDPPMPADRVADVTFQPEDDPEGAQAWLDAELAARDEVLAAHARLNHQMINAPVSPERARNVPQEWVRADGQQDPIPTGIFGTLTQGELPEISPASSYGTQFTFTAQSEERPNFPLEEIPDVVSIGSPRNWRRLATRRWR